MARSNSLAGSFAGARGARASQAPRAPAALLESFTTRPAFAGWVGGRLNSFYTGHIIRIRRASDDAEINVDCVVGTNRLDTAAVAAHCAGTTGYLKTVYDQSGNGKDLTQATAAKQQAVYESGALVLGANGYLAAHFDADAGYASAALGLTGTPALTMVYDVAQLGAGTPYMQTGLVDGLGTSAFFSDAWFDQGDETASYTSINFDGDSVAVNYPDFAYTTNRVQYALAAAADFADVTARMNGVAATTVPTAPDPWALTADMLLTWGLETWTPQDVHCSFLLLWAEALTPDEQATLDAWAEAHHA